MSGVPIQGQGRASDLEGIRVEALRLHAARVLHVIEWIVAIVGAVFITTAAVLYVSATPLLEDGWNVQRVLVAVTMMVSGLYLIGLSRRS